MIDKITILEIKTRRLTQPKALANVQRELAALTPVAAEIEADPRLAAIRAGLVEVNKALWEIEDLIQEKEALRDFGPEFIALARSVYRHNDQRAALKRQINLTFRSDLVEEKSYGGGGET